MDYLIKKSDQSIVQQWGGTTAKVKLPEQSGGDVVFTGDKRPLDLVQDADDMLGAVLAVKSAHPKPE